MIPKGMIKNVRDLLKEPRNSKDRNIAILTLAITEILKMIEDLDKRK